MTTTTPVRPSAPPAARRRRPGASRRQAAPWGFLAPAIVLFVLFLALPIAYAVYLSFRTEKVSGLGLGSGARTEVWNGFANYAASLADPEFLASVGRVALYGVIVVPTMLGLALLFALLLDSRRSRATKFSRISIFLPYAVPAVISSLLWGFLYLPGVSPFYYVFDRLGWDVPSLFSSDLVIFAVANIAVWGGVGFNMVVIYTVAARDPVGAVRGRRARRLQPDRDGVADQDPHRRPVDHHDVRLLDDRDPAGVRRADDPQAAQQHDLQHVDPAHEGVPRRLHPR